MFSGLTNQVSNWMGKKQDDENGSKSGESSAEPKIPSSPTKTSKLEMFGNVKNQMTNWIGSGIAGLRKASEGGESGAPAPEAAATSSAVDTEETGVRKDSDDDSSSTEGADSEVMVSDEEEEPKEGFGATAVSNKAIQGAKSFGNFLYTAVNKAGKTVTEAGAKIKKTVEENSILGDFNKEQEAFIKEKEAKGNGTPVPPWAGCANEQVVKEECLALSMDKRNFVRSPPSGIDFHFDYDVSYPVAMATLAEDPNLEKMRFELVPKVISEEKFWRNYFYRVSLICQANELHSMEGEGDPAGASVTPQDAVKQTENAHGTCPLASFKEEEVSEQPKNSNSVQSEEDFEKELDAELQDFEVVSDGANNSRWSSNSNSNRGDDLLDLEEFSDLK